MKKTLLLVIAAIMVFAACDEKHTRNQDPSILGSWQLTDIFFQSQFGGVHHEELEGTTIFHFQTGNQLMVTTITDGDTTVEDNLGWTLYCDTLMMFQHRDTDEEPGMPGVMQIQKLTDEEMRWCNLILGDVYIALKRL